MASPTKGAREVSEYSPQKGDRVRVVLEGEVLPDHEYGGFSIGTGVNSNFITHGAEHLVSVEKIEPPVVTFQPGDVVRGKSTGHVFLIREGGRWIALKNTHYGAGYESRTSVDFTSKNYELVSLG